MASLKIGRDLDRILKNKKLDKELSQMKVAIEKYMESRKLEKLNSKHQVNLLIIIFAILDISEEGFTELINRLNIVALQNMKMSDKDSSIVH